MAADLTRPMRGKTAPTAHNGPSTKEQASKRTPNLSSQNTPNLKSTKSAPSTLPTASQSISKPTKASNPSNVQDRFSSGPKGLAKDLPKQVDNSPTTQDAELGGGYIQNAIVPEESHEVDEPRLDLVDNERGGENEEQREDVVKTPPKASGSKGISVFQRGKDAATSLSSFVSKAHKLHSQLPTPVQKQITTRMRTGIQNAATTVQPAITGSEGKAQGVTEEAFHFPTSLAALSGLEVGKDGKILDDDGNEIGHVVDGEPHDLTGYVIGENGEILDEDDIVIGRVEPLGDNLASKTETLPAEHKASSLSDLANLPVTKRGSVKNQSGRVVGRIVEGDLGDLVGSTVNKNGEVLDEYGDLIGRAEAFSADKPAEGLDQAEDAQGVLLPVYSILNNRTINENGEILDEEGFLLGQVKEGQDIEALAGKVSNDKGQVLDDDGIVIGQIEMAPGEATENARRKQEDLQETELRDISILDGLQVDGEGNIADQNLTVLGVLDSGELPKITGMSVNDKGLILDDDGNIMGKARLVPDGAIAEPEKATEETAQELLPLSTLESLKCNKFGKIVDGDGIPVGELVEGDPRQLSRAGSQLDNQGRFWDNKGNTIGRARTLPLKDEDRGPFADFEEPFVAEEGEIHDTYGIRVGTLVEGEVRKLIGRAVDDDGDILDRRGNVLGHAELYEESEPESEQIDFSELEGLTPNKIGNVMGPDGIPIARLSEGDPAEVTGRKIDADGQIWGDGGKVIGKVTFIPEEERETITPFGDLGELVARKSGFVEDEDGNIVGKIIEGDPQQLYGHAVDDDGDIIDKRGNVKGRAERYFPSEEEEQEEEVDLSVLEGMTVNKMGNVVDENGSVWGRITSGIPKKLAGKRVDSQGQIWSDDGNVLSIVELVPASEREQSEGLFYGLEGLMVNNDGAITNSTDKIVGRLVEGDPVRLKGRAVDEDGEIIDKVGNIIGRSERWTPEAKPRDINPMTGRKINREGEVRDEDGNLIGQLTEGNLKSLVGKIVDDNGYIVDNDGNKIGECTLLENLPAEEPEEPVLSAEEIAQQEKEERDRDLATKMSAIVQQTLDSVGPLCKQITEVRVL